VVPVITPSPPGITPTPVVPPPEPGHQGKRHVRAQAHGSWLILTIKSGGGRCKVLISEPNG
jgi:hypothetical protein